MRGGQAGAEEQQQEEEEEENALDLSQWSLKERSHSTMIRVYKSYAIAFQHVGSEEVLAIYRSAWSTLSTGVDL